MTDVSTLLLWQKYKGNGCQDSRNMLIERFAHLVGITAGRLYGSTLVGLERDDLIGAGAIGLMKAVDQFDPERNIKFETYAITLIRGAILEMLRGDDWVPRLVRDQQKQLKQACTKLEATLGRPATDEEIAEELGITSEKLDKLLSNLGHTNLVSLDDVILGSDQQRRGDMIPSQDASLLDSAVLRERKQALASAIDRLNDRERTVVALYYHEGLTFKEMGVVLSVSESRAYQLHTQAVTRLRTYLQPEQELFTDRAAIVKTI